MNKLKKEATGKMTAAGSRSIDGLTRAPMYVIEREKRNEKHHTTN